MLTNYNMGDIRLAYIAGFFDGEGCVRVAGNKFQNTVELSVVNNDKAPLQFIVDTFGGTIYSPSRTAKYTHLHRWRVNGMSAGEVLERLLPYLIVKKKQAILALQAVGISPDLRWELGKKISALNSLQGKIRKEIK